MPSFLKNDSNYMPKNAVRILFCNQLTFKSFSILYFKSRPMGVTVRMTAKRNIFCCGRDLLTLAQCFGSSAYLGFRKNISEHTLTGCPQLTPSPAICRHLPITAYHGFRPTGSRVLMEPAQPVLHMQPLGIL